MQHCQPFMLRLRTTATLSVLALAIGIAGTGWLSTLTARGDVSRPAFAAAPATRAVTQRAHVPRVAAAAGGVRRAAAVASAPTYRAVATVAEPVASVMTPEPVPELVPLTTPSDKSLSWEQLRGHLDGRVLLHVSVDDNGRVSAASVAESSGDELLDAHALRSVWHWRFAVPTDQPDGLSGDVTLRYSSRMGMP